MVYTCSQEYKWPLKVWPNANVPDDLGLMAWVVMNILKVDIFCNYWVLSIKQVKMDLLQVLCQTTMKSRPQQINLLSISGPQTGTESESCLIGV